ncbi:uncharacterized protein LOC143054699 [Mytilus galloprovincialis]|uniref:uncharacterized protein LOC143054699 n=1 Tax=Mytilus galloprovincialis TaxID=29158 RepID=UPI003F7CAAE7
MAVEVSTTTSAWIDSSGIWLFCIEKNIFSVAMRDCPSIKVNVRVGHVAPSDKTQVRRCILFADDGLLESTLSNKTSPALLVVKNSCDFKFDKDAVKGLFSIGSESWAALVWSFAIVPGATFLGRPDHSNALDLPGMPVHNLNEILKCSCVVGGSIFVPNKDINVLTSELTVNDSGSESDQDDQGISDHDSAEDEHYTSIFQIRGSTYGGEYQLNLKEVQGALRQCISVPVRLLFQKDNPKDKNAISVNATVNSKDLQLGYIGVKKIPKVTKALTSGEIVTTSMKSVTSWFVRNLNSRKLKGSVVVCKKGKWLPDSDNNFYNADL